MATVKTIKPDGTGDFTTLQTWEDWADGQVSADQWAECYSGGDLGAVSFIGWAATPSAGTYPKVYTPAAQRHTGQDSTGAYLTYGGASVAVLVQLAYVRFEGIRLSLSGSATAFSSSGVNMVTGTYFSSNLVIHTGTGVGIAVSAFNGSDYTINIENNIMICNSGGTIAYMICCGVLATSGVRACIANVYNNTVYKKGGTLTRGIGFDRQSAGATANITINAKNNIVIGAGTADYGYINNAGTGSFTLNGSHNMSGDLTGDDWGATGAILSAVASSQFVNVSSDWNLKATANAVNAGTDLTGVGVTTDYSTTARTGTWDMGADEYVAIVSYTDHSNRSALPLSIWI